MDWQQRHLRLVLFTADQFLVALGSYGTELQALLQDAFHAGDLPLIRETLLKVRRALALDEEGMLAPVRLALWDLRSMLGGLLEPLNRDRWPAYTDGMWEAEENQMAQHVATIRLGRQCGSYEDEVTWREIVEELRSRVPGVQFPLDDLY